MNSMLHLITESDLRSQERFYRANLLNSLSGFKSVSLIGTANASGITNLGVFSSIIHLGSDPALIGYINRPRAAAPHTLANIEATGWYTINHIHPGMLHQAHSCSAKWPEEISEFEVCGLTPQYEADISAPFVAESRISYALQLVEVTPIKWNDTFLVIGAVKALRIHNASEVLGDDGFLHLHKSESITSLGLDGYFQTSLLERLPYAKPNSRPLEQGAGKQGNCGTGNIQWTI